jgi:hypothetical protein
VLTSAASSSPCSSSSSTTSCLSDSIPRNPGLGDYRISKTRLLQTELAGLRLGASDNLFPLEGLQPTGADGGSEATGGGNRGTAAVKCSAAGRELAEERRGNPVGNARGGGYSGAVRSRRWRRLECRRTAAAHRCRSDSISPFALLVSGSSLGVGGDEGSRACLPPCTTTARPARLGQA